MPFLNRITLFPIKSLHGVEVECADVLPGGALKWDREIALVDAEGAMLRAKNCPALQAIRPNYDLESRTVSFDDGESSTFDLDHETQGIEAWLSDFLSMEVRLLRDRNIGFPDDPNIYGPTVVSAATLQLVSEWFGLNLDETRRRFRANLEISEWELFREESLLAGEGNAVSFSIGNVEMEGLAPCPRCSVPTRDSYSGDADAGFTENFIAHRDRTLPTWIDRSYFKHLNCLSVRTRVSHVGAEARLTVGDELHVGEVRTGIEFPKPYGHFQDRLDEAMRLTEEGINGGHT